MSTTTVDRAPNWEYTTEEVTQALEAMANNNGSASQAVIQLATEGLGITEARLKQWAKRTYNEQYKQLRTRFAEENKERLAEAHHAAAVDALDIEAEVDTELRKRLDAGEITTKELTALKKAAAVASGIHTEKGQLLSGEATQRIERTPDEIMRALKKHGAKLSWIEGEATEEPAPELPAPSE